MLADKIERVVRDYDRLRAAVPLGRLRTKDYERAVEALDQILDEVGEDEKHPLAERADALGVFQLLPARLFERVGPAAAPQQSLAEL